MDKIVVFSRTSQLDKIFKAEFYERLSKLGELHIYDRDDYDDREYVLNFVKDADLMITAWGAPFLDDEIIKACPKLKKIIHAGGAVKQLLSDEFFNRGLSISTANGELAKGVAETTVGIMVAACKGMFVLPADTRNGLWRNPEKIKDFYDITIGIVSVGAIGKHVIKLLSSYEVEVLAYDPYVSKEQIEALGAKKCELDELITRSDVISLHTPNIPATDNMFNAERLALIKDGTYIINTARPNVFDDDALINELLKNRFTAILDVTNPEPPSKDHPFRQLPNVVLLPHIGGAVTNGCRRMGKFVVEEAERLYKGEKLLGEVDLSKLSIMA